MNEIIKTIQERKSVRNYAPDKVKPEDLKIIAESAILAPNAMNEQLWHITVVTDEAMLNRMNEAQKKGLANAPVDFLREKAKDPAFQVFFGAPAAVVITTKEDKFTLFDAGAAAQTLCLAARSLGYGTCVTASTEFMFMGDEKLMADIGVPEGYKFVCAIPLGVETDGPDDHVRDRNKDVINYV